jgi:RNA polymerase sigma-70 factor, ECF subfamily
MLCISVLCGADKCRKGSKRAVAIGEDAEFAELVERQWRFVFRVVYAVLLNSHDAEDAVQETFLKLYRNHGWHNMENERAFLARVAWRVAVDRKSSTIHMPVGENVAAMEEPQSAAPNPEEMLVRADTHALIHSMIDALPEELRVPLVLSADAEFNSREIGRILGVPEGTVRTRLQRARQLLRQKLSSLHSSTSLRQRAEEVPHD